MTVTTEGEGAVRAWFDQHGWKLEPADLRAALEERGADDDTIVTLLDEGADRRRAQPVTHERQAENSSGSSTTNVDRNGTSPTPVDAANAPPQNLEAEESVLGALMISPGAVAACVEILRPDGSEFLRPSHGIVYRAALALYEKSEPVDHITLINQLEEQGELEKAGGPIRIHELAAIVPASANVGHYARIVVETATLRGLIRSGGEISRLGWERPGETLDLVDRAQQITLELAGSVNGSETVQIGTPLRDSFARMTERYESGRDVVGLASGFRDLDRLTSGFEQGNLIILAARPSMGKSALAHAIAANVAIRQGLPVGVFTPEMSRAELSQRLLAREARVDLYRLRTGKLAADDWPRLTAACQKIDQAPIYVNDTGDLSLATIRAETRRLKQQHPSLALIVVDYLQLMSSPGENRTQEVSKLSRGLKILARDTEVPVLALSQLNRAVEQRTDKRPILSDLRESGAVEQDADLVAFLYRDEYYNPETTDAHGLAELILAKHRNGPTDKTKLAFQKNYATFTDVAA